MLNEVQEPLTLSIAAIVSADVTARWPGVSARSARGCVVFILTRRQFNPR